ncbi:hypothetical protein PDL71_14035 [Lacibacter sp. MH-610]|uniref:hypothetical protein n=1 Tax=Lacibacter sp. MH-610 TaxID=3020883 RepID=UPI0038917E3A
MKKIFAHIIPFPLHCFLVPVFFIVHNYFYFYGLIDMDELYTSYLWWLLLPLVLLIVFNYLFKNLSKAALFTTILLIIYFFFSAFTRGVKTIPMLEILGKYSISLPLLLIFLLFGYRILKKTKINFDKTHRFLLSLFLLLIVVDLVIYLPRGTNKLKAANSFKTFNRAALKQVPVDSTRPDIFFLVFDEHPSTASIKRLTGYDNSVLDSQLTKLGFQVSPFATSAFSQTQPALCSILDMGEYPYNPEQPAGFKELFAAGELLAQNQLFTFLQEQQYGIINASVFPFQNITAVQAPKEWWGQESDMIKNQTFFNRMHEDIGWLKAKYLPALFNNPIERSIHTDVALTDSVQKMIYRTIDEPASNSRFVFAHFFLPHDPYKYDSSGKIFQGSYPEYLEYTKTDQSFVQQVVYTRKLMLRLASDILAKNKRPAIIILQGDHGLRKYDKAKFGNKEVFNIFSAVYLPDRDMNNFPGDLYAPNTFRIILNLYFQQQLALLQKQQAAADRSMRKN